MASDVYAEDLEALLERLEGVAAARVIATDAGEIDRIYVTADGDEDESAIRRTVGSALMSGYSLAVDPWRIRVARLRPTAPARPRWYMQRVEEVLTATEVRVSVELRAEDGTTAPLVGRARGQLDAASRLRTAAQATLDALKSPLEADDRRAAVEAITPLSLAAGRAIVVALSLAGPASADRYVGAALVEGSDAEAVIAATLDAVGKRGTALQRRGWMMRDRQDELESMEAHFRRLREPQRVMPQPARDAQLSPDATEHAGVRVPAPAEGPPDRAAAGAEPAGDDEDEVATLEQIRPERQGGAEVAQPMNRPDVERGRFTPKSSMEDEFIKHLMTTGVAVHIRCRDGYEITDGVVRDFGTYSLLVETRGARELVFKHGIISIRPQRAADLRG
jgi:sRNA-binding regulator protein Hfq